MAVTLDRVVLHELYERRGWSLSKIAQHYQCHWMAVHRALRRYQIPTRPRGSVNPVAFDPVVLHELHVRRTWSLRKIAEHYRCAASTVHRALRRYQIPARPRAAVIPAAGTSLRVEIPVPPSDEQGRGWISGDTVIDIQLCRDFRAGAAIGRLVLEYGVSRDTVLRALMRGGVVSGCV